MSTLPSKSEKRSNVSRVLHWGDNPPTLIVLIGAPRFQSHFQGVARAHSLDGNIVLVPHVYSNTNGQSISKAEQDICHENTLRQIDMADIVFVINPGNVTNDFVREQIKYAKSLGRTVMYLETPASN